MLGTKLENSYLYKFENSDKDDLCFPEIWIPDPTQEDIQWKEKVDKALRKNSLSKVKTLLEYASDSAKLWRVWYILNVDHKLPDDSKMLSSICFNFVYNAYACSSSPEVCGLISLALPLKGINFHNALNSKGNKFEKMPVSVYYKWLDDRGSDDLYGLLEYFVKNGTVSDIAKLKREYKVNLSGDVLNQIVNRATDYKDVSYLEQIFDLDVDTSDISPKVIDYASANNRQDIAHFLKARIFSDQLTETKEQTDHWYPVNNTFVYKDDILPVQEGRIRHLFDFKARRYTAVMTENATGQSYVLFSENMHDIEGQSLIDEAAKALESSGGCAGDYRKPISSPVSLKAMNKP